jgi:hypothetical protein
MDTKTFLSIKLARVVLKQEAVYIVPSAYAAATVGIDSVMTGHLEGYQRSMELLGLPYDREIGVPPVWIALLLTRPDPLAFVNTLDKNRLPELYQALYDQNIHTIVSAEAVARGFCKPEDQHTYVDTPEHIYCFSGGKSGFWAPYNDNTQYGVFTECDIPSIWHFHGCRGIQYYDVPFADLKFEFPVISGRAFSNCVFQGEQGVWFPRCVPEEGGTFVSLKGAIYHPKVFRREISEIRWVPDPGHTWEIL